MRGDGGRVRAAGCGGAWIRYALGVVAALAGIVLLLVAALTVNALSRRDHVASVSAHPVAPATGQAVVDRPLTSAGCGKSAPLPAGTTGSGTLVSGGLVRSYRLHVPIRYQPTHPYPLVLNFHGHGSTAIHQEAATGFSRLADQHGFIVTYPQGIVGPDGRTGWGSGGPHKPHVDDVLFVSDLITALQNKLCVDPSRIYATGFSNGGGLTSVLACRLAGRIAAFAPVSGSYFTPPGGCWPVRPTPILEIHGTGDGVVPYGGEQAIHLIGAWSWVRAWAQRDNCATTPAEIVSRGGVSEFQWHGCRGGATVIHYRIAGGAHVWPGAAGAPRADASLGASAVIWDFFAAHALPSATSPAPSRST